EYWVEPCLYSSASKWRACAGNILIRIFQLYFVADDFSYTLRVIRSERYPSVDRQVHRRIRCACSSDLHDDPLAGVLRRSHEPQGYCAGSDDRRRGGDLFHDVDIVAFARAGRIATCEADEVWG